MQSRIRILLFNNFVCSFVESCFVLIKIKLVDEEIHSNPFKIEIAFSKYFNSFLIIKLDFLIWDIFLITAFAASCAKEFTLHGIFIFCKILIISLEPQAYPILNPGKPNDFVKDLKIKILSYFFT